MSKEAEVLLAKLTAMGIPAKQLTGPHHDMVMSECDIRMRRVADGKEVTFKDDLVWSDDDDELKLSTYIWEEGNFQCTCNRGRFFDRALKIPEEEIPDYKCGDDEYLVEIKDWTGKVIYSDIPS